MTNSLQAVNLSISYNNISVLRNCDINIPSGKITIFIGCNGCGKSSLLRTIARLQKPTCGAVILDGKDIHTQTTKEVAKKLSILPQSSHSPDGLNVYQLVRLGRYPHQQWYERHNAEDEQKIEWALIKTNMLSLAHKSLASLSGGQRQRAWIAMILAQDTETILLDEPTTYLDITHQIEILDLLYELNQNEGRTIVMVLHDINMACRYADNIVAIKNREIVAQGTVEEVITAKTMETIFDLPCQIMHDPIYNSPICVAYGKRK